MKIIPIEKALELAHNISKEACLTQKEENIFDLILASVKPIEIENKLFLKVSDLKNFLLNFGDAVKQKDFSWLTQRRGLKVDKRVDIEEFVKSKEYLHQAKQIRPVIMKGLSDFWSSSGYIQALLTGSTGWGKDFWTRDSIAYMVYTLSCYWNPQLEFDLGLGSSIMLVNQSKTEKLAKRVMFGQFAQMLRESPYFIKHFPYDPSVKSELRFPKNIYVFPAGGGDDAALGMDVWGGSLSELNFMERTADSVYTQFTGEEEYDQAERAYNSLIRRMKGRFVQKGGKLPGRLILNSSVNYRGDFTDRMKDEITKEMADTGKTFTFLMEMSQWESLPKSHFEGKYFCVEVGDASRRSRILENKADAIGGAEVLEVPIEYKPEFVRDLEGALKDIAGRVVGTSSPFIPYRELIKKAQTKHVELHNGQMLFTKPIIFLSTMDKFEQDWDELVNHEYIENEIILKEDIFAGHIDLGLNKKKGDAVGVDIGRILGYTMLPSYKYYNEKKEKFVEVNDIKAPIYHIDGALQVRAKLNDEVDFEKIRDLILYLRGFINLKWVTMDGFQNVMMRQAFRKAKIRTGDLSVDTTTAPYTELKLAIKDERIYLPDHEILSTELKDLQKDDDKIDHLKNGSKDVSDGAAGVVYILQHKVANYRGKRKSRRLTEERERTGLRKIRTPNSKRRLRIL